MVGNKNRSLFFPLGYFRFNMSSLRCQYTSHLYLTVHFGKSSERYSRSKSKVICFGGQPTNHLNNKTGPLSCDVTTDMLAAASQTFLCSSTNKNASFSALLMSLFLKTWLVFDSITLDSCVFYHLISSIVKCVIARIFSCRNLKLKLLYSVVERSIEST